MKSFRFRYPSCLSLLLAFAVVSPSSLEAFRPAPKVPTTPRAPSVSKARSVPRYYQGRPWQPALGAAGSGASELRGMRARPARRPEQGLHLWSFEGSPFSRLIRERLCENEIPYTLHNLGKEHWTEVGPARQRIKPGPYRPIPGGKRDAFFQQHGRVQVPYLEDPNSGEALFESARILAYLEKNYG